MRRRARSHGFTLVELMVVVLILGILIAVALPGFRSQVMRSRAAEASQVLSSIRQAEESYYGIYSRYCDARTWNPADLPPPESVVALDTSAAGWDQLGVNPGGPVRFQYAVLAGGAGTRPPAGIGGYNGTEHWYVSRARADLDGDGVTMVVEGYSITPRVYVGVGNGDEPGEYLASGWE